MEKRVISLCKYMIIMPFIFFCNNKSLGQEKITITPGFGTIELLNLGLRFDFEQSQLGVGIGALPGNNGGLSVTGNYYYHFGGSSELSVVRPWYAKSGIVYLKSKTDTYIDSYLFLDIRIGRDFNFSKKIGMAIDAGPAIQLIHTTTDTEGGWSFPVFPALGLAFFYRF